MKKNALIYCEGNFGKMDGKTANGLIRSSDKYNIVGVIDSTKRGMDTGEILMESKNNIPVFSSFDNAPIKLRFSLLKIPNHKTISSTCL